MDSKYLNRAETELTEKLESFSRTQKAILDRRMQGPIPPNGRIVLSALRKIRKPDLLLILAISSWYIDEALGFLLREQVEQKLAENPDDFVQIALNSRQGAQAMLLSSYSERDFFGNFLKTAKDMLSKSEVILSLPPKAKRTVRRRGYRDHGTLRPNHRWTEKHDISLTEEQNQIEEKREIHQELFDSFWSGLWTK